MKDLHENFILLHNFEHDNAPIKKWVLEDETYVGQYHLSWDALMPLVEKIERLGYSVEITETYCLINSSTPQNIVETGGGNYTKLSATYDAAVEFIKWYDTAPKP